MDDLPEGVGTRHPTADDHARVIAVLDDWWGGFQGEEGARRRAARLPRLFLEHFADTSFVAEGPDGRLAGFLVGFLSQSQPATAYIHFVGVDPSWRCTGLARGLYARFFEEAARRGARTVRCVVSPGNEGSLAFHRRLGFVPDPGDAIVDGVPVRRDHDGPGLDRIALGRRLDPTA